MGSFSIWHWLVVLAVVLLLFGGGGKISRLMGDFGKGLKSFKKSMSDEDTSEVDEKDKDTKSIKSERRKAANKSGNNQAAADEDDENDDDTGSTRSDTDVERKKAASG